MKKIFVLFCLLFGLLTIGVNSAISESLNLQVTFINNPMIVAPGTNNYIELALRNNGNQDIQDIDITASSWDSTVIIPQGNWDIFIDDLGAGSSTTALYEFKVPSTVSPGLYQVVFEIYYEGYYTRQTAIIKVEGANILDIESVTPTSIRIGEAATLVFNITNNGGTSIQNILFTWEDPNNLILPIGADNRIMISSIAAKNHTELPIVVMASSGISPGVYPLTITMDFYGGTGTKQTITSTVGLQISGTTTFDVVLQTSASSSTTFAVVNTGANTASSVVVSIPQQLNYATSGISSTSLGNLAAGDYTLASFQLSLKSSNTTTQFPSFNRTGTGNTQPDRNFSRSPDMFMNQSISGIGGSQLLVQITYTDLFGVRQTVQKQVNLASGSSSGFSSRTSGNFPGNFGGSSDNSQSSGSSNSLMYIAIGVAGIIIIVAVIQLGRKNKLGRFSKLFKGRKE
jgi:hypothetical protein